MPAAPTTREMNRALTVERLARATVELADSANSLDAVPIEAITDAASMSRRSFFNHFPSKEAALLWPLGQVTEKLFAAFKALPDESDTWLALERATLAALTIEPGIMHLAATADRLIEGTPALVYAELGADATRDHFAEIVRRCKRDPDTDPYPHLIGTSSYAILRISLKLWRIAGVEPASTTRRAFADGRLGLAADRNDGVGWR